MSFGQNLSMSQSLLVISNIVLWVLALGIGIVLLALARQIGVLYERISPAGVNRADTEALKVGDPGPDLSVPDLDGKTLTIGGADDRRTLLLFVSLTCPICNEILPEIGKIVDDSVRLILTGTGDTEAYREFVKLKGVAEFPFVVSAELGNVFDVSILPFAVVLEKDGKIGAMRMVNSGAQVQAVLS